MTTSRRGLLLLAAIASLPLACKDGGCGGSSGTAPSATSAASAPSGSVALALSGSGSGSSPWAKRSRIAAQGPGASIFRAANGLDLTPEQRATMDKIGADLREGARAQTDGAGRADLKAIHDEIVAGVKAGKVEQSKIDAQQALFEKSAKATHERESEGLNKLHAALQPEQRATIVANIKSAEEKRAAAAKTHDGGRPNATRARYEALVKDLGLDAEQQKKVEASFPKDDGKDPREEARKQTDALVTAFEKETFDAKKADYDVKARLKPMVDHMKFVVQILPTLTPAQRDKLASRFNRPTRGARGRFDRPHEAQEEDDDP